MNTIDWNTYARAYDLLRSIAPYRTMHDQVADAVLHHYRNVPGRILDAGCGTGNLLTALVARNIPSAYMVGIDASRDMRVIAEQKHGALGADIRTADLNAPLPFASGTFSVITCINALYAVANPAATIREFARVLHPEGILIVVTPHHDANLGLILKAHCKSSKPDRYWMQFTQGDSFARALIQEAFEHNNFDPALLDILFTANTTIHASDEKHFLRLQELCDICKSAGLTPRLVKTTYAGQALLVHASPT
ncbi:hypothetical protein A3C87_03790 [Candidatus Kaiserbacteria bacterium RIFCSPHIGHO2_02_FULL_49_34]|uniref:Methyltransferase domain-containing protein n=1 Tax=Candidatus Kaiserbacteria bacterium RIFCSPHIGHO2_02_FULL_49_34 TaxID=1798491 RepID=A0A1F6DIL8_9BACT|nr:MAG: hypothetical protein A3C87_03790 [Candidatus Kaiserbacteria bacterium RIFCSPHIGHO2_02_FULL_49_34]